MSKAADDFVPPDSDFEDEPSGGGATLGSYLNQLLPFVQTGAQVYQAINTKGGAPKPTATASKPFNWRPVLIGGGALVGLVLLVLLFRRK